MSNSTVGSWSITLASSSPPSLAGPSTATRSSPTKVYFGLAGTPFSVFLLRSRCVMKLAHHRGRVIREENPIGDRREWIRSKRRRD